MKKGSKKNILFYLFLLVVFTFLGLGYVSIKLKCEALTKDKILAEGMLSAVKNKKLSLVADKQNLTSEERIVKIAEDELGMVRDNDPKIRLSVSKEKIEKLQKILNDKYE